MCEDKFQSYTGKGKKVSQNRDTIKTKRINVWYDASERNGDTPGTE